MTVASIAPDGIDDEVSDGDTVEKTTMQEISDMSTASIALLTFTISPNITANQHSITSQMGSNRHNRG